MSKLKKLPEDCTFPQLAVVLDEPRFAASLQASLGAGLAPGAVAIRSLKLKRVYYKPGRSCRVTFRAKMRGGDGRRGEQLYYAKMFAAGKAERVYERARRGRPTAPEFGPAVAILPELSMVVWAYPNDPNLPGLALLADGDAVAAHLRSAPQCFGLSPGGELLALEVEAGKYVPGQRCGCFYRARWRAADGQEMEHRFYGKAYQPGLGRAAHDILRRLAESEACRGGALRVPAPYGLDADHDIVWQEMLPGVPFSKEASACDLQAAAAPVGAALAAFHATRLELGPGLGLEHEVGELRRSCARIANAYPQFRHRGAALERGLLQAVPGLPAVPSAPVHGSFKISHIFAVGGQVAFIDFDGAGLGDPTYDVGRFLAHLAVAGLNSKTEAETVAAAYERFRAAYAAGVPWEWPEARVRWYTSALLLSSQAYKCVKRLVPDRVGAILGAAEAWFPGRDGGG